MAAAIAHPRQQEAHQQPTQPPTTRAIISKSTEIHTLAAHAPIAAASLASGPPAPGSSPEVLFRYYLASELRRMGSPFDDSVIDKYVKQHTKTLDAARKAGSASPTSRLSPAPSSATSQPAASSSAGTSASATALTAASLLDVLTPSLVVKNNPSPFTLSASGMGSHITASIDTSAIFSPAMVEESLPETSVELSPPATPDPDMDEESLPPTPGFHSPGNILGVPASLAAISEELRPSAEEYKRLSSKEKRQLRNKVSARNFRTRRKEYIGQLEDQIADRDQIIEGLRQQVAQLSIVNRGLDEEVKTLKARALSQTDVSRILDALQKNITPIMAEMGPPAAPLQLGGTGQQPMVTLPTLAGPALARTPMRNSNSSTSLSDFFGGITNSNRPGTPMQTSRPSTPISPLFPALGATNVSGSNGNVKQGLLSGPWPVYCKA
ncbi:unnamed protein product [Tilletia controversa]|uniref:BZIP domain-containing protein n=3 Tax=Tilletia TaxID=13289 RepID=A0A8X7SWQ7_9BASI|nr:hypothetical protein CF336_g4369 [Tilletia laevis]KAE8196183.1 hypothetical protein CF328_g4211 [Tilletia controversa]KAE8259924.1 hypothetical protein A4X03_0g3954 [Tilletia caries]KAE8201277.1 hypothetical protein CF335_g3775 [Tilletia laevis]KAE8246989.1 hypothetical protein A4X06_0g4775 [Tilletia controversa]